MINEAGLRPCNPIYLENGLLAFLVTFGQREHRGAVLVHFIRRITTHCGVPPTVKTGTFNNLELSANKDFLLSL